MVLRWNTHLNFNHMWLKYLMQIDTQMIQIYTSIKDEKEVRNYLRNRRKNTLKHVKTEGEAQVENSVFLSDLFLEFCIIFSYKRCSLNNFYRHYRGLFFTFKFNYAISPITSCVRIYHCAYCIIGMICFVYYVSFINLKLSQSA